ncbi:RNA-binding domain-containing protein [Anaerobiospirillum thomasii]|uniref:Divergent AAA domain n=1 Tax=Anaerobiospirillum thomasii TaxID=179995 RepID=A0A2X0VRL1_9GAMM|nr:RNA-binding domain-containing protein [Anaerobiospirillum thomasii]SPT70410.1 Divergent AAA domain [Anaerobiospirillum thomasii]
MQFQKNFNVELKEQLTSDLKKEVVAFANTCDGIIYIGINNQGEVVGLQDCDDVIERASASIRDAIKPDLSMHVSLKVTKVENKDIVVIEVLRGTYRPYYIAEKGLKSSGVYIRQGNSSVPASEDYIRQMIKETDGDSFEKLRSINQDLTFDYADKFFKNEEIDFGNAQKKTLGMISVNGLYTNLALLLSDQCIHTIKIAVFEGTERYKFKDRKEFTGSLLKQMTEAFEYIDFLNKTGSTIEGLKRKDKRDYPLDAVREALLNAIVHREYSFSASTIINIFDDRIEFMSLGGLVSGLSIEAIMLGASQSRNEKLANLFYRLKLIEAYGTGIQKILVSYKEFSFKPVFKSETGAFLTTLKNVNYNEQVDVTIESNDIVLNDDYNNIFDLLAAGEKSRKEIQDYTNLTQTKCIKMLNKLISIGKIQKIDSGKNTRYKKL